MMTHIYSIVFFVCLLLVSQVECDSTVRRLRSSVQPTKDVASQSISCNIQVIFVMLDDSFQEVSSPSRHDIVCIHQDESYSVIGPYSHLLGEYAGLSIEISPVLVNHTAMVVEVIDHPSFDNLPGGFHHRNLQEHPPAFGNRSVLALLVSFLDTAPSYGAKQLSDVLFGPYNGRNITMKSQFAACSFDKLHMNPASGSNIEVGVGEVSVARNTSQVYRSQAERLTREAVKEKYGDVENAFDHIMFCMPSGIKHSPSRETWAAYAYVNSPLSFYNDMACLYTSVAMHELGHNFGLGHSNFGAQYGDSTGSMGKGYAHIGGPRRCYNAEKNYLLGWYSDRVAEVNILDRTQPWKNSLVAFPDYDKTEDSEVVVVRVNGALDNRGMPISYYIQFNSAKGVNKGTQMLQNMIVVVKGYSFGRTATFGSYIIASAGGGGIALETNDWRYVPEPPRQQSIANFADTGFDLLITICSQQYGDKDFAVVSIHLDDGNQHDTCMPTISDSSIPPMSSSSPELTSTENPTASPTQYCQDDANESFFINRIWGNQDCRWLSIRQPWQRLLCNKIGHPVRKACPATCNLCTEPDLSPNAYCDDEQNVGFDTVQGIRTCSWLAQSALWQEHLCKPHQYAYHICEETCGKCRDLCEDSQTGTFIVDRLNGEEHDCAWLAIRPGWARVLCLDETVSGLCQESCDSC